MAWRLARGVLFVAAVVAVLFVFVLARVDRSTPADGESDDRCETFSNGSGGGYICYR